jgi:MoxR-like ATPase
MELKELLEAREHALRNIVPRVPEDYTVQWFEELDEKSRVGLLSLAVEDEFRLAAGSREWAEKINQLLKGEGFWEELSVTDPYTLWAVAKSLKHASAPQPHNPTEITGIRKEVVKMGEKGFDQIESARERLKSVENTLNAIVVGHEDFVKALMIASVAGEHIVVIGPPGTAKSYAVRTFAQLLNAKFYSYLLTKFTSYDELFGTVDVATLTTKGEFRRNWSKIVSSDFIFLDEIFKANSAILNALLSLLQERLVYDPMSGQAHSCALWTTVGASNETPEDPELVALYDRFTVKVFIDYLNDDASLLRAIQARWLSANNPKPIASMDDIKTLNNYALNLFRGKIKDLGDVWKIYHINVVPTVKKLREKGILISDRSIVEKMPKLFSAYLALYGVTVDNVMNAPFDLMTYLARTREELREIKKAIDELLGEIAELAKKLEKAKELLRSSNIQGAKSAILDVLNYDITRLEKTPWLKPRVEAILASARQYLETIRQIEEQISRLAQY